MTRYADGPTAEETIEIRATPEVVWALVSDPSMPAANSSELQMARWDELPYGKPGLGATIVGTNRHTAVGEWKTTSTVVVWEPPSRFEWAVGDVDAPAASWRFEVEEAADGVVLRQWCRLGPGPSGLSPVIEAMPDREEQIVAHRLDEHRANMRANLAAVKHAAEAGRH